MRHHGILVVVLIGLGSLAGCGSPAPVGPTTSSHVDPELPDNSESTLSPTGISNRSEGHELELSPSGEVSGTEEDPAVQPINAFRPPDLRPSHDPEKIAQHGIGLHESRRLRLYTDLDPATARSLPPLVDALFEEWQTYFGPLPPARDGSDIQLSGYVMRDQQPFREAGLLPVNLPVFAHGKHQGQEFWMNDQTHDYYRRHLLLHEATHCFMQMMGGTTIDVPLWYLEGMAELFATHRVDDNGNVSFRVVPEQPGEYVGLGRIEMIRQDLTRGEALSISELSALSSRRFRRRQSAYAWSWAMCVVADRNPKYRGLLQELSRRYPSEGFAEIHQSLFGPIAEDFQAEWTLFTRELAYGFDIGRSAIEFERGVRPTATISEVSVSVAASRGWQSSLVEVTKEKAYRIEATGRVTLADEPKPWISEADGVTIRYAEGQPIGRLLGIIISEPDTSANGQRLLSDVIPLGRKTSLSSPATGTLYLRVNDFRNEMADNRGEYSVTITRD